MKFEKKDKLIKNKPLSPPKTPPKKPKPSGYTI